MLSLLPLSFNLGSFHRSLFNDNDNDNGDGDGDDADISLHFALVSHPDRIELT